MFHFIYLPGSSIDYIPLVNLGGRFQFLSNGTLWIESALPYDEGNYMCKSENGVGTPLTKTIFVSVNGMYLVFSNKFKYFRIYERYVCGTISNRLDF